MGHLEQKKTIGMPKIQAQVKRIQDDLPELIRIYKEKYLK